MTANCTKDCAAQGRVCICMPPRDRRTGEKVDTRKPEEKPAPRTDGRGRN